MSKDLNVSSRAAGCNLVLYVFLSLKAVGPIDCHYMTDRLHRFELKIFFCVLLKKQSYLHLGCPGGVMNLVATHYNCTSPMDYISHHALHPHIPLHQSHSCHHSLINPDCFTTPAPHSHTHISSSLPCTHREVLFCTG